MARLIEHKPGERVIIDGTEYEVVATTVPRCMCIVCALDGLTHGEKAYKACSKVQCFPAYREDRTRVYYRLVK